MNKKLSKLLAKKCHFCDEDDVNLLEVHRIKPGNEGGKYNIKNTVICCSLCHTKNHTGRIKILGKHSIGYDFVVHYIEDGVEKWA